MKITDKLAVPGAWVFALIALWATSSVAQERPRVRTSDLDSNRSERSQREATPRGSERHGESSPREWAVRGTPPQGQSGRAPAQTWHGEQRQAWPRQPGNSTRGEDRGGWRSAMPVLPFHDVPRDGNRDRRGWRDNDHRDGSTWRDNGFRGGSGWQGNGFRDGSAWRGDRRSDRRSGNFEGRVARLEHARGGYHVWLDHCVDPFWIPDARFLLWPLRVGLSVRFGSGWDPAGFYNVYDVGPVGGSYNAYDSYNAYNSYNARVILQGTVWSVDWDSGTVVVRDAASGRYVTVLLGGDDPRFGDLATGEYVVLSGAWGSGGAFEAYRVEDLRSR